MKVSLVQMNSQDDKSANLKSARTLIEKAVAEEQPDLVVLPEYYAFLGNTPEEMHDSAETFPNGESVSYEYGDHGQPTRLLSSRFGALVQGTSYNALLRPTASSQWPAHHRRAVECIPCAQSAFRGSPV